MSRSIPKTVREELKRHGFTQKRKSKHFIFSNANGQNVVISASPSDINAERAMLREIETRAKSPRNPMSRITPLDLSLPKQEKWKASPAGNSGGKSAAGGSGFIYTPSRTPVTSDEQREADRLRGMQDKVIERVRIAQRRWKQEAERLLQQIFTSYLIINVRRSLARLMRMYPNTKTKWRGMSSIERRESIRYFAKGTLRTDVSPTLVLLTDDYRAQGTMSFDFPDWSYDDGEFIHTWNLGDFDFDYETRGKIVRHILGGWKLLLMTSPCPKHLGVPQELNPKIKRRLERLC